MKTIKVKLDEITVEVSKLPLGKYAELLRAIRELPKHIKELQGKDNDAIVEVLPALIAESLPDVVNILTIATPLKNEEIEFLGLDEITRLIVAIWEVNNYSEVFKNIKKVTSPQS